MPADLSVARWVEVVPRRQWPREGAALAALGPGIPEALASCPPLLEVHRLDLSLFVVLEEAALRVSGALVRRAPTEAALAFASQQVLDEARHLEVFRDRLDASRAAAGRDAGDPDAVLTPPLRAFLGRCREVADAGSYVEALALMNLVLEGMAHPLYAYEARYWRPVDPYLAGLVDGASADERRHVAFGAEVVGTLLAGDPAGRDRARRAVAEARASLDGIFRHYVRSFVRLFDAVARRHGALFAGACVAPGKPIATTPYEEQVAIIQANVRDAHERLLCRAGLA